MKFFYWMRALFVCLMTLSSLTACGDLFKIKEEKRPKSWSPDQVTLVCSDQSKCPSHQGVLVSYRSTKDSISISRCTASLYNSTHIITAGHCRVKQPHNAFFLPVAKPGLRALRINAKYVQGRDEGRWDYASYELDQPITDRSFVYPAPKATAGDITMVALVINKISGDNYKLDSLECAHKKTRLWPVTVDLNPNSFYLSDCRSVEGNSGGAIFEASDLDSVYGILAKGAVDPKSEDDIAWRKNQLGMVFWTVATNARCFSLPGWPQSALCSENN